MSNYLEIIEAQALASEKQHAAQIKLKTAIADRLADAAKMLREAPEHDARSALWMAGEVMVDAIREIWRVAR